MSKGFVVGASGGDILAAISVIYPEGSELSCKDEMESIELKASNSNGMWIFNLPFLGTWTVSASNGLSSKSERVEITEAGQCVNVELSYWRGELYTPGNQWESITGGWQARAWNGTAQYQAIAPTLTFNAETGFMDIQITTGTKSGVVEVQKNVNLTDFSTLSLTVENVSSNLGVVSIVAVKRDETYWYTSAASIKYKALSQITADTPLTTTVEDLTGDYDILIGLNTSGKAAFSVSDVHLE